MGQYLLCAIFAFTVLANTEAPPGHFSLIWKFFVLIHGSFTILFCIIFVDIFNINKQKVAALSYLKIRSWTANMKKRYTLVTGEWNLRNNRDRYRHVYIFLVRKKKETFFEKCLSVNWISAKFLTFGPECLEQNLIKTNHL